MYEFSDLICGYQKPLLEAGSGNILAGQLTVVVGPNGTGKSTLLKTLAGQLPPVTGQLNWLSPGEPRPAYLPATLTIQQGLTGLDLLDILKAKKSKWYSETIFSALDSKKLLETPLEQLSSGEKQRVVLSAVLSHPHSLAILDEPLTYLDWFHGHALSELLTSQADAGRAVVLSCHDLNWSLLLNSARAIALDQGRVVAQGDVSDVLTSAELQKAFKFRCCLTDNPLSDKKLLALAAHERQRE